PAPADPHRVLPARGVPAPPPPGAHPGRPLRARLGLRLRRDVQQHPRLSGVPAAQAGVRRRAPAAAHGARRRVRAARGAAVTLAGWWHRRTLHTRLSLLVTGAVGVAVLTLAALAFGAVAEIQQHQLQSELSADAQAIAANPAQWRTAQAVLPDPHRDDERRGHDVGPRWQILDASGAIVSESTNPLPVTGAARA